MVAGSGTFIDESQLNHFEIYTQTESDTPKLILQKYVLRVIPNLFFPFEPFPFRERFEIGIHTHHGKTIFFGWRNVFMAWKQIAKAFDYFKNP
jgi:hypothetical protein